MRLKRALIGITVAIVLLFLALIVVQVLNTADTASKNASDATDEQIATRPDITQRREGTPEIASGRSMGRDCRDCPEMIFISGGQFVIGLTGEEAKTAQVPHNSWSLELPRRGMTVSESFAISATEITRAQFARFVETSGHRPSGCLVFNGYAWVKDPEKSWRDPGFTQQENDPVVCVSYRSALAYIEWLGARTGRYYGLPSESQWDLAARAGDVALAPWRQWSGDAPAICSIANVADQTFGEVFKSRPASSLAACRDGFVPTSPVRALPPNQFGVFGTVGNVRELVSDCFAPHLAARPMGGGPYSQRDCDKRVARGGGWWDGHAGARIGNRTEMATDIGRADTGFRVIKEIAVQN